MANPKSEIQVHCAYDKLVPVTQLKPHHQNRNKHPKEQIERLAKIIKYQGIRSPIKVSKRSGLITAGHGRLEAFKELKLKKVPVNYQDYETEEQEYADLQADNAVALWAELDLSGINADVPNLGPDFDIDLLGIKDFVLEPADKFNPQSDEDEVPENVDTRCKLSDRWALGRHVLVCGDSTSIDDVEKLMMGEKADMVFTDPPYGINEKTERIDNKRNRSAKSTNWARIKGDENTNLAKKISEFVIDMAPTVILWGANFYCHSLPETGNWLVWDKRVDDKQRDDNSDCELAWVKTTKKSVRIFRHLWKGMIKASENGQRRVHPTQKPIALAEWAFEVYGPDDKKVLDLFGGSGSTLIACEKTNRKCFMMELDPHYCDVILARWEKYTGKEAMLEAGGLSGKDGKKTNRNRRNVS